MTLLVAPANTTAPSSSPAVANPGALTLPSQAKPEVLPGAWPLPGRSNFGRLVFCTSTRVQLVILPIMEMSLASGSKGWGKRDWEESW